MAKIEYHRDRGNYLEIYDHESLNDINDALYEYCEKTSITDAPDAFVELPVYLRDIYAIRTPPVSVIHIGYGRCEQVPDMRSSYSSGAHPRGTS